jgi:hypothetical protein
VRGWSALERRLREATAQILQRGESDHGEVWTEGVDVLLVAAASNYLG